MGHLEFATFGAFEGVSGPATVAQVSFISAVFLTPIDVEFGSALIRTPLPGAVWFFLSAIGALGALRRRA
ncbi:MAG: hypothetical protein AB8G16_07560 [Gammaproteobacteria bacterium]